MNPAENTITPHELLFTALSQNKQSCGILTQKWTYVTMKINEIPKRIQETVVGSTDMLFYHCFSTFFKRKVCG